MTVPNLRRRRSWRAVASGAAAVAVACAAGPCTAQSLEQILDEQRFLDGMADLQLPELLEHYIDSHPSDDPAVAAAYRIALERTRLRDPDADLGQRSASIERVLSVRRQLVSDLAEDPRRGSWLLDQVADLFFDLLPLDGSGIVTMFGLPSREQRFRAQRVAREMHALGLAAETVIEESILMIESDPAFAADPGLRLQRREMTEVERDLRVPFFRGIGGCLHAALNEKDADRRQRLYRQSADRLLAVAPRLGDALAFHARLYAALALAHLGEHAECLILLEQAPDADRSPTDAFMVEMVRVLNASLRGGPSDALTLLDGMDARYDDPDDLLFRLLLADARFMTRLAMSRDAAPARRGDLVRSALGAYDALLLPDARADIEVRRSFVFERLNRAVSLVPPGTKLPATAMIAYGHDLARDPQRREVGIPILRKLADETGEDWVRALVRGILARALYDDGQLVDAAEQYFSLAAGDHPDAPEAASALDRALTITCEVYYADPRDAAIRSMLKNYLEAALARDAGAPMSHRWRYVAGRVAVDEERYADALALFESVPEGEPEWFDAQFMKASVARAWAGAVDNGSDERRLNQERVEYYDRVYGLLASAAADAVDPARAAAYRNYRAHLRVFKAEALNQMDEPRRAALALEGIESDTTLDPDIIADAMITRIQAFRLRGRSASAIEAIEGLIERAPAVVPRVLPPILTSLRQDVLSLAEDFQLDAALQRAERELAPLADTLEQWLVTNEIDPIQAEALRWSNAEAYRLAERYADALVIYEDLVGAAPGDARYLFGRAECLFGLNLPPGLSEAMLAYRRLAAAGPEIGRDIYWWSQLRMLQILDRVGKNAEKIGPKIRRLRLADPDLGGNRIRHEFDELQRKH